jgi:hypothetical protein
MCYTVKDNSQDSQDKEVQMKYGEKKVPVRTRFSTPALGPTQSPTQWVKR